MRFATVSELAGTAPGKSAGARLVRRRVPGFAAFDEIRLRRAAGRLADLVVCFADFFFAAVRVVGLRRGVDFLGPRLVEVFCSPPSDDQTASSALAICSSVRRVFTLFGAASTILPADSGRASSSAVLKSSH